MSYSRQTQTKHRITLQLKQRNTDNMFSISWKRTNHISNLRNEVYYRNQHLNVPKSQFILYYGNTELLDDKSFDDYNLSNNCTIIWCIQNRDKKSEIRQNQNQKTKLRSDQKRNNIEITLHLQEKGTDRTFSINKWRINKKWFGSKMRRKIISHFRMYDRTKIQLMYNNETIHTNVKHSAEHYGISNGDTIIWSRPTVQRNPANKVEFLLQKSGSGSRKYFVMNKHRDF
eukprot:105446_1